MNMGWSIWVTIEKLEDLARRPIIWNRIRCRAKAVKGIFAILISLKSAVKVVLNLFLVLLRVVSYSAQWLASPPPVRDLVYLGHG